MHTASVARKAILSTLVALMVLTSALLVFAPAASANREDCPLGKVCFWEGPTYGGNRAFFESTGCYSLGNINPRSAWNHTNSRIALLEGRPTLWPGDFFHDQPAYGGSVCITS
jgi:hypothetical protein